MFLTLAIICNLEDLSKLIKKGFERNNHKKSMRKLITSITLESNGI